MSEEDKTGANASPPPETWLWDLYPLAESAWGNIPGFNDGSGDGSTVDMRMWVRPDDILANPLPLYRPARAPLPSLYADGGLRRCYIPQAEDLKLVSRLWPKIVDAGNPSWPRVEAELIAAGKSHDELAKLNAPTLLLLMAKAQGESVPVKVSAAGAQSVLKTIAEQLRDIPIHTGRISYAEKMAGRLLAEALKNGAFAEIKYAPLRALVDERIEKGCYGSAFLSMVGLLRQYEPDSPAVAQYPDAGSPLYVNGCLLLATAIEAEANVLEAERVLTPPVPGRLEAEVLRNRHDDEIQARKERHDRRQADVQAVASGKWGYASESGQMVHLRSGMYPLPILQSATNVSEPETECRNVAKPTDLFNSDLLNHVSASIKVIHHERAAAKPDGSIHHNAARRISVALADLVTPILLRQNCAFEGVRYRTPGKPSTSNDFPEFRAAVNWCGKICEVFDNVPAQGGLKLLKQITSDVSFDTDTERKRRLYEIQTSIRDWWADQICNTSDILGRCAAILSEWRIDLANLVALESDGGKNKKLFWSIARRTTLWFFMLAGVLCDVGWGAWTWGEGDNLWRKITNSWVWFGAAFVAVAFIYPFLLGKERWRRLKSWRGDDK
jgi:hypothetical protein